MKETGENMYVIFRKEKVIMYMTRRVGIRSCFRRPRRLLVQEGYSLECSVVANH